MVYTLYHYTLVRDPREKGRSRINSPLSYLPEKIPVFDFYLLSVGLMTKSKYLDTMAGQKLVF